MSLVDPTSPAAADRAFQSYLDRTEGILFKQLAPLLAAAVRLQVATNGLRAEAYVVERGQKMLQRQYERVYRDTFRDVDAETKAVPGIIETKAILRDFMDEQEDFLEREAAQKIVGIASTLRQFIAETILRLVKEGVANNEIAKQIRNDAAGIGKVRAARIARTETHNAALAATVESLKYKRIKVRRKQWWTALDTRVRPTHAAVHAEIVDMDDTFTVGDAEMSRPGDGPPEETINCRCALLFLTEESAEG